MKSTKGYYTKASNKIRIPKDLTLHGYKVLAYSASGVIHEKIHNAFVNTKIDVEEFFKIAAMMPKHLETSYIFIVNKDNKLAAYVLEHFLYEAGNKTRITYSFKTVAEDSYATIGSGSDTASCFYRTRKTNAVNSVYASSLLHQKTVGIGINFISFDTVDKSIKGTVKNFNLDTAYQIYTETPYRKKEGILPFSKTPSVNTFTNLIDHDYERI